MFERFSERARQVVALAQDEARALKHDYIGTEHLLLALLRDEEGVAARVLWGFDLEIEYVRARVREIVGEGDAIPTTHISLTPDAKETLERALREALALGHNYIGTEHTSSASDTRAWEPASSPMSVQMQKRSARPSSTGSRGLARQFVKPQPRRGPVSALRRRARRPSRSRWAVCFPQSRSAS